MTALKVDVEQVLAVAAAAFARCGYDGVSIRDIAVETGASATALHYHFGTKEALYREACDAAYERFIDALRARLHAGGHPQDPAALAVAMFDEWSADPTTLLLTDRDAVDALTAPERWLTGAHYPRTLALIREVHRQVLGGPVDEELAFAFAALVFGYCSLLGIETRVKTNAERSGAPVEPDQRASLAHFAGRLWQLR